METLQDRSHTAAPHQIASSHDEQQERIALRAQGLKKRNDEEVAHIVLTPRILPETPAQLKLRQDKDKELAKIDPRRL